MKRYGLECIVFLFIVLFMYTAVSKSISYDRFIIQLGRSPLFKGNASFIGWLVPTIEFIAVILLIVKKWLRWGLLLSFVLMTLFTLYVTWILFFSPSIPCTCGGVFDTLGWRPHLAFNLSFLALSVVGIFLYRSRNDKHFNQAVHSLK